MTVFCTTVKKITVFILQFYLNLTLLGVIIAETSMMVYVQIYQLAALDLLGLASSTLNIVCFGSPLGGLVSIQTS